MTHLPALGFLALLASFIYFVIHIEKKKAKKDNHNIDHDYLDNEIKYERIPVEIAGALTGHFVADNKFKNIAYKYATNVLPYKYLSTPYYSINTLSVCIATMAVLTERIFIQRYVKEFSVSKEWIEDFRQYYWNYFYSEIYKEHKSEDLQYYIPFFIKYISKNTPIEFDWETVLSHFTSNIAHLSLGLQPINRKIFDPYEKENEKRIYKAKFGEAGQKLIRGIENNINSIFPEQNDIYLNYCHRITPDIDQFFINKELIFEKNKPFRNYRTAIWEIKDLDEFIAKQKEFSQNSQKTPEETA